MVPESLQDSSRCTDFGRGFLGFDLGLPSPCSSKACCCFLRKYSCLISSRRAFSSSFRSRSSSALRLRAKWIHKRLGQRHSSEGQVYQPQLLQPSPGCFCGTLCRFLELWELGAKGTGERGRGGTESPGKLESAGTTDNSFPGLQTGSLIIPMGSEEQDSQGAVDTKDHPREGAHVTAAQMSTVVASRC